MGEILVPLFVIWMLVVGLYVPARRRMLSPAAAAFTADWIDPKGAVSDPVPVPVGDTYMSLASEVPVNAARATIQLLDMFVIESNEWNERRD
jgi:hypothetical protein